MKTLRNRLFPLFAVTALLCGLAWLPGCSTPVAVDNNTVGTAKLGELQVFADQHFDSVVEAARQGIASDGLFKTGEELKATEAVLNARDGADTSITIKLKEVTPGHVSIKIRYGLSGDIAASQRLYKEIEKHF